VVGVEKVKAMNAKQISGGQKEIGKQCHSRCAIFHQVGDCVMPREGIFVRVLEGGRVRPGDAIAACVPESVAPAGDRQKIDNPPSEVRP
jgi:hypothetical protein